jgi:hypothetical protein
VTVVPLSVPAAVPATLRPPGQFALNDPVAEVAVCCVGVQLKLVQLVGDGRTFAVADCHVPISAAMEDALGPVLVVLLSYDTQALAATHTANAHAQM